MSAAGRPNPRVLPAGGASAVRPPGPGPTVVKRVRDVTGAGGSVVSAVAVPFASAAAQARLGPHGRGDQWLEGASKPLPLQFAQVLGRDLVPYFTDFPVSWTETSGLAEWASLLQQPSWLTAEVTSAALGGSRVRSFTLLPDRDFLETLREDPVLGRPFVELAKVRLFCSATSQEVRFRAVPLVLLAPLTSSSVALAGKALRLPTEESAQREQVAGVLAYLAWKLMLGAFVTFTRGLGLHLSGQVDELAEEVVLGATLRRHLAGLTHAELTNAFDALVPVDDADAEFGRGLPGATLRWDTADVAGSGAQAIVGDDMVGPFADAQRVLRGLDPDPQGWHRSATRLRTAARDQGTNAATVSLAVDVLNDLGWSVPAFYEDDSAVIERGYRQGESTPDITPAASRLGGELASLPISLLIVDPTTLDPAAAVQPLLTRRNQHRRPPAPRRRTWRLAGGGEGRSGQGRVREPVELLAPGAVSREGNQDACGGEPEHDGPNDAVGDARVGQAADCAEVRAERGRTFGTRSAGRSDRACPSWAVASVDR